MRLESDKVMQEWKRVVRPDSCMCRKWKGQDNTVTDNMQEDLRELGREKSLGQRSMKINCMCISKL